MKFNVGTFPLLTSIMFSCTSFASKQELHTLDSNPLAFSRIKTAHPEITPQGSDANEALLTRYRNPVQVVVFPFRIENGKVEYLLLQRVLKRGGGWQGVSGAVEIGEKLDDAAARELMEETGLKAAVQSIDYQFEYPIKEKFRHIYAPDAESIQEHSFITNITGLGDPVLSNEHDAFKWVKLDEIDVDSLQWEGSRFAIKIANENIMEQLTVKD